MSLHNLQPGALLQLWRAGIRSSGCRALLLRQAALSVPNPPRRTLTSTHTHPSVQAAGRPIHRTAFTKGAADGSLLFNPFDMQMKNVANTGVIHWGNKLLALYEVRLRGRGEGTADVWRQQSL